MIKLLFFDYREIETVTGFTRELQQPAKYPSNPLFTADQPWENGNLQLYGSVVKPPNKPFQLWYTVTHPPFNLYMAYAESDDGIVWRKPLFDIFEFDGHKTNIVYTAEPHGPAIIYDEADPRPDWKYKMLCGNTPTGGIRNYKSADGIHWTRVGRTPVIPTNPDCPMALFRAPDGRFAAFHRLYGCGRRIFRSESWDFIYWSGEPRMIMEPDAGDPPQLEFYGMGGTSYGSYEIGTLWTYHTDADDMHPLKFNGYQEAELTYARGGYAWHRAAQGTPFIPHGPKGSWEQGNVQCASAPVFLEDEIRYYYAGSTMRHDPKWELSQQTAGLGLAVIKPDRFVALTAADSPADFVTCIVSLPAPHLFVNAKTAPDGWVKVEVLHESGKPLSGLQAEDCIPLIGDGTAMHVVWKGSGIAVPPVDQPIRLRVHARKASIYSVFSCEPGDAGTYWDFQPFRP